MSTCWSAPLMLRVDFIGNQPTEEWRTADGLRARLEICQPSAASMPAVSAPLMLARYPRPYHGLPDAGR